ncbi:MAG: hypothetical protein IIV81_01170 [Clostridia bacterium]|nr:hypothetical protein [Clostridia bacterium]
MAYETPTNKGSNSTAKLMEKLEKKEKIFAAYMGEVMSPFFAYPYSWSGADMVIVDMEHGAFNPEHVGDFAVACNDVNFPVIARVQDCEYHCISKCIDQGCDGILLPRTETMEQVELAIASMRFFPKGKKGVGGRACLRGDSIEEFNKKRLIFLQIESPLGVSNLDEILTKHGEEIAGIIIGPSDMSIMCGCPLDMNDERLIVQIKKTIEICKAHDKSVGMFMGSLKDCAKWHKEGMNIFWTGGECGCLGMGLKHYAEKIGALE